jgi:hypothetical protein
MGWLALSRVGRKWLGGALILLLLLLAARLSAKRAQSSTPHLGYGFNVGDWDASLVQSMGFGWMKVFDPPTEPQPVNVLLRVRANATNMNNLSAFAEEMRQLAQFQGKYIEAYEIGNEVNLDASYGWAAAPIASQYATLLCVAYDNIKLVDPSAIIVSAGLAPTGRVQGNWQGHPGHNGLYQDEREYLREFLGAGGGNCLDALGYHPTGFSADYNAPPDVSSSNPTANCSNGFCFRGVEKIYQIMQAFGYGGKKVWATEFGWIVRPPDHCLNDPTWQGRLWQLVTEQKQATNLVGAYQYADAHWPWMGDMFVFNLNFNAPGWLQECEQMRYYAVENRPAEAALRNMSKNAAILTAGLRVEPGELLWLLDVDDQPASRRVALNLRNRGWATLVYEVKADTAANVVPQLGNASGTIGSGAETQVPVTINSNGRSPGNYTGTITVKAASGTQGAPVTVPIKVRVMRDVQRYYLPVALGS